MRPSEKKTQGGLKSNRRSGVWRMEQRSQTAHFQGIWVFLEGRNGPPQAQHGRTPRVLASHVVPHHFWKKSLFRPRWSPIDPLGPPPAWARACGLRWRTEVWRLLNGWYPPDDQASFIRRGGGKFGQDPPTQLWTHPDPPPLIILWGAFFVNQIEANALSRVRHPQRVTPKTSQYQSSNQGSLELQLRSLTTGLPTSSDSFVQRRVHSFNMLSKKSPPCEKLPPAHLPPAQRHNRKGHQQTARQGSCDQRKKVWQEPNPGNPRNYKRGEGPEL